MTSEEFRQKQKEITDSELCEMVEKLLYDLCHHGADKLQISVPSRVDDSDMLLYELLERFEEKIQ